MESPEIERQQHVQMARQSLAAVDQLLDKAAEKALDDDDTEQASENLWSAANHAFKALCVGRRWAHEEYRDLQQAARWLAEETGDNFFMMAFSIAHSHHIFAQSYETDDLEFNRPMVKQLVDKVIALAEAAPR